MTVRKKTLIIIVMTLIGLLVILCITFRFILIGSFVALEKKDITQNVQRALNALSNEIDKLSSTTADWASWDDTCKFVEELNTGYIETNLVDTTFMEIRLNLMLFANSSGMIVFVKFFDLKSRKEAPIPQNIPGHPSKNDFLFRHLSTKSSIKGIVLHLLRSSYPLFCHFDVRRNLLHMLKIPHFIRNDKKRVLCY